MSKTTTLIEGDWIYDLVKIMPEGIKEIRLTTKGDFDIDVTLALSPFVKKSRSLTRRL